MPGQIRAPESTGVTGNLPPRTSPRTAAAPRSVFMKWTLVLFLGALYIATSASLISFNKYLMDGDRFPFAMTLVLIHMVFAAISTWVMYLVKPSLFPAMSDPVKKVPIDASLMFKNLLPIAVLFSGQLVLSNHAYLHSNVAFLQMMKEGNLVLVYLLSLLAMLETFQWRNIGILVFVVAATTLTIVGEVHFSMDGFLIQGSSQLFECSKIVLQALVLSEAGKKFDALSYVLMITPLCACVLVCLQIVFYFVEPQYSFVAAWPHFETWWKILALNALVAFSVNVVIAFFIKHSSAVAFILAGIVKDVMIVTFGSVMFHEHISPVQMIGFTLQLVGILTWSLCKSFPEKFEDGFLRGLGRTLCWYPDRKAGKLQSDYGSTKV